MVHGIDIFYWGLSILFCMAFGFAILVWCRGWRREEREEAARRMSEFATEVSRLNSAVEQLEHTAASLQTADELLAQGIKELRSVAGDVQATRAVGNQVDTGQPTPPAPTPTRPVAETPPSDIPVDGDDRYAAARRMLQEGHDPAEVARELDIGTAEVKMIARVVERERQAGGATTSGPD